MSDLWQDRQWDASAFVGPIVCLVPLTWVFQHCHADPLDHLGDA